MVDPQKDLDNKENIFKGFGDQEDEKKGKMNVLIPVIGVVIVLGLFIYLVASLIGTDDTTTMAVSDLTDEEAAVQENQQLLEGIGVDTQTGEVTSSAQAELDAESIGVTAEQPTLKETTITNYFTAVKKVLELKSASDSQDLVKTAELVTDIQLYIDGLESGASLVSPWQRVIACVYTGCENEVYINMIDAFASQDLTNSKHKLISSLIETAQYWDGKNTVLFSASLTKTNKMVLDTSDAGLISQWNQMIKCNGACNEFNSLLFQTIAAVIE
jgi:hypothetical protein